MKNTVFIIDGYGQIFRHYYAFMSNPLKDKNGRNVSAVYGFFSTFFSIINKYKPEYFCVAMDTGGKTFRHELFPDYKANRIKTPEDLISQIPLITDILKEMNVSVYSQTSMEADDVIATVCLNAKKEGIKPVIVTSDKDLMQLVDSEVSVLRPPTSNSKSYVFCGPNEVKDIYGVMPDQIVDYLTILGDVSDNVPGIRGLGEVSAVKLLSEFGTLDSVYDNMDRHSKAVANKLLASKDRIELSRELIKLKNDLFELKISDFMNMKTDKISYYKSVEKFKQIGSKRLVELVCEMSSEDEIERTEKKEKKSETIIQDNVLTGFDIKERLKNLDDTQLESYFDCGIAQWMLNSDYGDYSEDAVFSLYGIDVEDEENKMGILRKELTDRLKESSLYELFTGMEMPLLRVLSDMEKNGIFINADELNTYSLELNEKCKEIEKSVWDLCGKEFNLNSPKQLQEVLFIDRNLPTGKKTKSGFSTDSDVLQELFIKTEDIVPKLILDYRMYNKLLNTYVNVLPSLVSEKTGRIHTTFLQTGTGTGRLSSKNPNLQNIPVRTEEGRRIRSAFIPSSGCKLLSADYSQIELAVLADMTSDEVLKKAFIDGSDVHKETAALIFNVIPELVTSHMRSIAKTINFGVIYGMSSFRLSQDLGISNKAAKDFIDTYFDKYRKVKNFIEEVKEQAFNNGYVRTKLGHIRYINDIRSANANVRQAAERSAVNTVIQGTASEIMKLSMISIYNRIKEKALKSKMLLQVHDEIILEVPEDEIQTVKKLVKDSMENAFKLSIPLRVSIECADNWGQIH